MTSEEILAAVRPLVESASIEKGKVCFCDSFDCDYDDEPHDIAWETGCRLQEVLESLGLTADWDSDNDSIFGTIKEKSTP